MPAQTATPAETSGKKIALISMPCLSVVFPSFQLGLLKATLEREGIATQTFSMYLYFAAHIGWELNETLSEVRRCMAGEWIWSKAAFGDFADDQAYLRDFKGNLDDICTVSGVTLDDIVALREDKVFSFIDFCVERIDWERFDLIGFSVVFQQMVSSLALSRALKARYPHIPIIFGGATFEDDIADGILRGCPWIDYLHCGDADTTFPQMIRRLRAGESMAGLPGLMWRRGEEIQYHGRAPNLADLNQTPIPDFDEYFYARQESGYARYSEAKEPMLPIETARGCWWGMKAHCTFCGLNRAGMDFRAKDVDQVLEMLETLASRYGVLHFDAIDNIMATEYIDVLFGKLAESHADIKVHYEVRPYLSRQQLRHMSRGGLFSVQPGIESLSTHVLKLMKKHTTAVRNLAFLKWCNYYNINNLYFILLGFPGETVEDYQQQCEVVARIQHLLPPRGIAQARADRGSPMFTDPEANAVSRLFPSHCYRYIYPTDRFDHQRVSYYFDHDQENILEDRDYQRIYSLVWQWQQRWKKGPRPTLRYFKTWKKMIIDDRRNGGPRKHTFGERASRLYELCNDAQKREAIDKAFDGDSAWVEEALGHFVDQDLIIHLDDRYLSLALPANAYI